MLNVLMLADFVLQLPIARSGFVQACRDTNIDLRSAFRLWHGCLRWWSMRVPLAYLAISTAGWAVESWATSEGLRSFGGFLWMAFLIYALISAMRLIPLRKLHFEEIGWEPHSFPTH